MVKASKINIFRLDRIGRNPGIKEMMVVGTQAGITQTCAKMIAQEVKENVEKDLNDILESYR